MKLLDKTRFTLFTFFILLEYAEDHIEEGPFLALKMNIWYTLVCDSEQSPTWYYKKSKFHSDVKVVSHFNTLTLLTTYKDTGMYFCYGEHENGDTFLESVLIIIYGRCALLL